MAYGDFAGGILPFPGATQRDALLELLGTRGLSTDITVPFYQDFMQQRAAAQSSRQDYLSQMLSTLLTSATEGQSARQAGMVSDALAQAYGVKAGTPLEQKVEGITSSLYPERQNPLKEMPGGLSPLAQAPVSYEDMLALNQAVKTGVQQGKSLEQIKQEATARVQQLFLNPNYAAPPAGSSEVVASTEPQYIMPENWAAIQGQMNSIIERAYEQYAGQPGVAPPAQAAAAPTTTGTSSALGVGDILKMLTGAGTVLGTGYLGLKAAQKFMPYKYPTAPTSPTTPTGGSTSAALPTTPGAGAYGVPGGYKPGVAPTAGTPRVAAPPSYGIQGQYQPWGGGTPRTPTGKFYSPGGGLNAMAPLFISDLASRMAFGEDELTQTAQLDQLREESVPLDESWFSSMDVNSLPSSLREQIWQDPQTGQWYVYLPVGLM